MQWKQTSAELTALFEQWQAQQQNGPRLPKSTGQQLWKRFRDARAIVDKHRREFYAELDDAHKVARDQKTRLVERAEALAPKGEDGIAAYRELLDQWKTAGRAGKKVDDALWARFKAAGDALYGARVERESGGRRGLRGEDRRQARAARRGRAVADETDIAKARSAPDRHPASLGRDRSHLPAREGACARRRAPQDRAALRTREDVDWKRNNPETKARASDMTRSCTEAIEKLEDELAAAQQTGDKAAIAKAKDALDARKAWLKALGG